MRISYPRHHTFLQGKTRVMSNRPQMTRICLTAKRVMTVLGFMIIFMMLVISILKS